MTSTGNTPRSTVSCCNRGMEKRDGTRVIGFQTGQPARVRIDWNRCYGSNEGMLEPLVALCQELGLREYVPREYEAKVA